MHVSANSLFIKRHIANIASRCAHRSFFFKINDQYLTLSKADNNYRLLCASNSNALQFPFPNIPCVFDYVMNLICGYIYKMLHL